MLGLLGTPTPYQNDGKRVEVKDIEKEANTDKIYYEGNSIFDESDNLIIKVDKCREYIELIIQKHYDIIYPTDNAIMQIEIHDKTVKGTNRFWSNFAIYNSNITSHLTNAKIWLGFELGRIREQKLN